MQNIQEVLDTKLDGNGMGLSDAERLKIVTDYVQQMADDNKWMVKDFEEHVDDFIETQGG